MENINVITIGLDTLWVMIAAFMVFIMQAGFGMLEAGLIRTKNTCNVLMNNFFANNPVCGPSRASLWCGFYPHTTGYYGYDQNNNQWRDNHVMKDCITLFEHFYRNDEFKLLLTNLYLRSNKLDKAIVNSIPYINDSAVRPDIVEYIAESFESPDSFVENYKNGVIKKESLCCLTEIIGINDGNPIKYIASTMIDLEKITKKNPLATSTSYSALCSPPGATASC